MSADTLPASPSENANGYSLGWPDAQSYSRFADALEDLARDIEEMGAAE